MEPELYAALDARLRRLEHDYASLRADLTAAAPLTASAAAAASAPVPPPAAGAPQPAPVPAWIYEPRVSNRPALSFEAIFAGRGLQIVGLVLVLLGVAFFLNLAFTRGWIGPVERIIMGLIAGTALLAFGAQRLRAAATPIAEGLVALGAGILYLSLWASVAVFPQLHVPRPAAFLAMIAVTGILALLAATRRSERVALMGIAGGFVTPVLLNTGTAEQATLGAYILLLGAAFAWLGVRTRSRFVDGAAFIGSALYLPAFMPVGTWSTAQAFAVTTALCALFAVAFSAGAIRDRAATTRHLVFLGLDALAYVTVLIDLFWEHQTTLGIAYLGLAAGALLAARFVSAPRALVAMYTYIGLGAATLALPALLHREALIDALALEGGLLAAIGARREARPVAYAGAVLLGVVALWLVAKAMIDPPAGTAFSSLALSFAIVIGAIIAAGRELAASLRDKPPNAGWRALAIVSANTVGVIAFSRVMLDALGGPSWNVSVPSHVEVALSLAWAAYATVLFGIGLSYRNALAQRQGLVLLGITILKVFAIDLASVDVSWRIVSFVVLGIVCIAISAWYMRSRPNGPDEAVS